ncbi:MAG TPA: AraC family transcriptional regulator [Candidatus Eisenbergiella merdipullorum]|uniref:AraC family transcriptional regulator n=1 Tax=Candidatus Eisenbergiella merdipullorum TaxID=2838553 RepID=A0A9D2KZN0_9FIRM|nr:AraC family transcriptional regulator [Candidatus Eisenbergiella merdipullorum]
MINFKKQKSIPTYLKYFMSYFIIFSVLILGFFFIIRYNLSRRYLNQLSEQSMSQLENLTVELTDDLIFLEHINSSLQSNVKLIRYRYNASGWQTYETHQELQKYISANKMISDICFTVKNNTETICSTKNIISYRDNIFRITNAGNYQDFLDFDPQPYLGMSSGQLIFLSNENYLIYFPAQSSTLDYMIFFFIDKNEIMRSLKKNISDINPAMVLIDSNRQIVTGVNAEQLAPYLESFSLETGIFNIDSDSSICINTGIPGGFSVVSLISNASLKRQLDYAYASSYLLLILLSCAGFLLVLLAMKITYLPLRRLTKKIIHNSTYRQEYLEQLNDVFTNVVEQNHLLEKKLKKYQLFVKKSLLDSAIEPNYFDIQGALPNIDRLFDLEFPKEIFAIQMKTPQGEIPYLLLQSAFQEALSDKDSCIILKRNADSALFLINFIGSEPNKKKVLWELLHDFYRKQGCFSAMSDGSKSPLDIPALCERAIHASSLWPEIPVVDYLDLPPAKTSFTYPHEQLEQLNKMLQSMNFDETKNVLKEIRYIIDDAVQKENPLPDFYVRSILVDLTTSIIGYMIQTKIAPEAYEDLYHETLFFCRSCSYTEKAEAIESNIYRLLDICQQKANVHITSARIRQLIEESYCQPNFSIYELAEKLHISFTYASNLVKKKLNQNFADYVWTLRLEKAKELLKQTDLSIDEIGAAVGYINTSSFRRKFKQETGLTPSEFRQRECG